MNVTPSSRRVILSGLVAAAIHFVLTGIANGVILRNELQTWMATAGVALHPLPSPIAMPLWAAMSLSFGLIGMWYYAGMRARRGKGLRTALVVGLSLWLVSKLTMALDLAALGMMPLRVIAGQAIAGLVALVPAVVISARISDGKASRGH